MIEAIRTDDAPFVRFSDGSEPPLSQAIRVGELVFTSGRGPLDPVTRAIPEDFAAQVRQVLGNVVAVLTAGGSGRALIVRRTRRLSRSWCAKVCGSRSMLSARCGIAGE